MNSEKEEKRKLSWRRDDFERRFGFEGGRYTKAGSASSGLFALIFAVAFYLALIFVPDNYFKDLFTSRGWTPYAVVFLGFWAFFILFLKTRKIRMQREPLRYMIFPVPETPDEPPFTLTVDTVDDVANTIHHQVESPMDFLVYRRIVQTLATIRNSGQVSDVDAIFRTQAEQDENVSQTSYALVNGFLWAIPILGFIGTVMGLSDAIGNFTGVLTASTDVSEITPALKDVTSGLSTAFDTTFVALAVALALQLFSTFVHKSEEELLDECSEFCTTNVVTKLRIRARAEPITEGAKGATHES